MGKPFVYAVISSANNLKKLDYYIDINNKLADPRKINRSDKKAKKLIKKGKTFVVITHGIHSTEVGSTLSSTLIAHRLASSNDKEIKKILDNTIVVIVPSLNPDGVDIVKNWYDKTLGTKFEGTGPPELYHKYVGHDNNRDWYAFTQVETQYTIDKVHNVFSSARFCTMFTNKDQMLQDSLFRHTSIRLSQMFRKRWWKATQNSEILLPKKCAKKVLRELLQVRHMMHGRLPELIRIIMAASEFYPKQPRHVSLLR